MAIRKADYDKILKEHFDIMDTQTRKIMLAINEADQNKVLSSLTSKLYESIVSKISDIDFGSIPDTKGDITKIQNYDEMLECLDTITKLLKEYKQSTEPVKIIQDSINNVIDLKDLFEKGFRFEVDLPELIYSTIVLSIVTSISFLISTTIEFIKFPNSSDFQVTLNKVALTKTNNNLLFSNLQKFNKCCASGKMKQCLEYSIKSKTQNVLGSSLTFVASGVIITTLILNIIPIIKELIFFFYYSRTKLSDYLEVQSNLLKMNIYNLETDNTISKNKKKQIITKQTKIADLLQKTSDKIAVDYNKAEKNTIKDISSDKKVYKTSDLVDSVPDSASSAIF